MQFDKYELLTASWVRERDGLSVEFSLIENDEPVAEIFRDDEHQSVTVTLFAPLPLAVIERLIQEAHERLDV